MFVLNFGVRSLKIVAMPKHVGVKEFRNTLIVKLYTCWYYQSFNVSKCAE